jgi:hypothetical protein
MTMVIRETSFRLPALSLVRAKIIVKTLTPQKAKIPA